MNFRSDMLQAAQRAPKLLDDAFGLVHDFVWNQLNSDGGFKDRAGRSDLYYTVFGLESLLALNVTPPLVTLEKYLQSFGTGEHLDFVHLTCLARCYAALPAEKLPWQRRAPMLQRMENFRTADGGYHPSIGQPHGTIYAAFLALGAYQDLQAPLPDAPALVRSINRLRIPGGGYANDPSVPLGTTPATAAACNVLRHLGQTPDAATALWLNDRAQPRGGFLATPHAPLPDLLSTGVALHALAGSNFSLVPLRESTLDFLDSLWSNRGAFHATWADDALDCEYVYYALLALGHLS